MEKINIALFGAGIWGKKLLRVLHDKAHVNLVITRNNEIKSYLHEHYPDVRHSTDVSDAYADPHIQAIVIATPIDSHATLVEQALNAGKHVFVEKPLSKDTQIVTALHQKAAAKNLTLMTDYTFLHSPTCVFLKEYMEDKTVRRITGTWYKFGSFSSGIAENLLVHDIAIAAAFLGDIREVRAKSTPLISNYVIKTDLVCAQGIASLSVNRLSPITSKTMTYHTDGETIIWTRDTVRSQDQKTKEEHILFKVHEHISPLEQAIKLFIDSVTGPHKTRHESIDRNVADTLSKLKTLGYE